MALAVLGLPLDDAGAGPADIRRASQRYADWLPALAGGFRAADYGDVEVVRDDPAVAFMQAHERLADIVAAGAAPLVLGGDALVSVPVLQVLTGKLRGRLGVVAFTPAYEIAPEPLYAPASRWARALELGVVSPANLALVGGRATPPDGPARRVLDGLGATTFSLEDVLRDGMATVAQEALETAASGTEAVYLSVDLGRRRRRRRPRRAAGEGARRRRRGRVERAARGGGHLRTSVGSGCVARRRRSRRRRPHRRRDRRRRGAPALLSQQSHPQGGSVDQHSTPTPVVNAFNEWDPLEEIVVGRVDENTLVPPWDVIMPAVVHDKTQWDFFKRHGGTPWPVGDAEEGGARPRRASSTSWSRRASPCASRSPTPTSARSPRPTGRSRAAATR